MKVYIYQTWFTFLVEDDSDQRIMDTVLSSMAERNLPANSAADGPLMEGLRESPSLDAGGLKEGSESDEEPDGSTLKRFRDRGVKLLFPSRTGGSNDVS